MKSLYFAIFSSHLTYGCQLWAQEQNSHNKKVFSLQKRAMRIMTFAKYTEPSLPIFSQLKILQLSDQVKLRNCVFVFNAIHKTSPPCFHNYFTLVTDVHGINTRNSSFGCIYVNKQNTVRYGLNSVTKKSIDDWNFFSQKFINGLINFSQNQLKDSLTSFFFDFLPLFLI